MLVKVKGAASAAEANVLVEVLEAHESARRDGTHFVVIDCEF